jgi:ferrous iron transport protein A
MTLDRIPRDSTALVVSVDGTGASALRLMEMGIVPGAQVRVVKSAPLGDPIQICLRNYHLAVRRNEAQAVTVAICKD